MIAAILLLFTVFAVTTSTAERTMDDGMILKIVTSEQEYDVNEEIQILLLAKENNSKMNLVPRMHKRVVYQARQK